jgi:small subunit ribosomal protein S16
MSGCIRLRRIGKNPKRRYFFRISVFNKTRSRDSRCIEELGFYDPTKEPALIKINKQRLQYWLSCGAKMSDTVKSLIKIVDKKPKIVIPESKTEEKAEAEVDTKEKIETEAEEKHKIEAKQETESVAEGKPKSDKNS